MLKQLILHCLPLLAACASGPLTERAEAPPPDSAPLEATAERASERLAAAIAVFPPGARCGPEWCRIDPLRGEKRWRDVAGTSGDDVWLATGDDPVLHFDGKVLRSHSTGAGDVVKLFVAAPDDVWAFGSLGAAHWDGSTFRLVAPELTSGVAGAVWGSSGRDIYLLLTRASPLLHWDGRAWSAVESAPKARGYSLAGTAPDDVWMGSQHFDGTQWTYRGGPEDIVSLRAFEADDVWALSWRGSGPTLHHFDGARWTKVEQTFPVSGSYPKLSGTSSEDLWIGDYRYAHHFDGQTWRSHEVRSGSELSTIGGETYAFGVRSRLIRLDRDGEDVMLTEEPPPSLADVWAASNDDVWAVGAQGTVMHYDGKRVEKLETDTADTLYAVWGTRSDDVWIAGAAGTLLHWQGERLEVVPSGTTADLRAVYGAQNASEVWIGGTGVLLRATAEGVREVPLANLVAPIGLVPGQPVTKKEIVDIHGADASYIWAVLIGTGATEYNHSYVARFDGTWRPVENHGFFLAPPRHLWVLGRDDVWLLRQPDNPRFPSSYGHWDGKDWTDHLAESSPGRWLFAMPVIPYTGAYDNFVFGEKDIWAVGFEGFWVHSTGAEHPEWIGAQR